MTSKKDLSGLVSEGQPQLEAIRPMHGDHLSGLVSEGQPQLEAIRPMHGDHLSGLVSEGQPQRLPGWAPLW